MARPKAEDAASKQTFVGLRLDDATYDAVRTWASTHTQGNISQAIRELIVVGLDPRAAVNEEMEDADSKLEELTTNLERMMEEGVERMVRANSKGAKASMGSLYLLSKYLQPMADGIEALGDHLEEYAEKVDGFTEWDSSSDYSFAFKTTNAQGFDVARDQNIYDFAFSVGGKLNRAGASTSLSAAEKGLSVLGHTDLEAEGV